MVVGVHQHVESRLPSVCVGGWRALRAAGVSLTAVGLAVGGHLYGGGMAPSVGVLTIVWAIGSLVSWQLSRRRWTVPTLTGVLVLTQVVMHGLCSLHGQMAMTHGGLTMVGGHAVATAISVATLRYGEDAVWAVAEAVLLRPVGVLAGLVGSPAIRWRHCRAQPWPDCRAVTAWLLICANPLRGPPVPR